MSNRLVKELENQKKKQFEEVQADKIVQNAKELLLEAADKEEELLNTIGLDHQLKYERRLTEDYNRTKTAEEIYKGSSYTGAQLKEFCLAYDLKVLHARHYNGTIPTDLARKITAYAESIGQDPLSRRFAKNLFIMAPSEQFKTIKKVPMSQDPILFYRTNTHAGTSMYDDDPASEHHIFAQIHNWGNDFTKLRVFRTLFHTIKDREVDKSNLYYTVWAIILILAGFGLTAIAGVMWLSMITLFVASMFLAFAGLDEDSIMDKYWNRTEYN